MLQRWLLKKVKQSKKKVCFSKFFFNCWLFFFVGNKHFLQKKYNDAIHCYNQALKQNGEKAIYYVNRALCYIKLKQWDKVYQDARHCLDLEPNYIKAHAYLGQYYIEQQRYDEAIASFKQALELCKVCCKKF
jgi:STIP1 family protein 1